MWIYTNSPNTPSYLTPGKLYKIKLTRRNESGGRIPADDGGSIFVHIPRSAHLEGGCFHILSDYNSKHLEG